MKSVSVLRDVSSNGAFISTNRESSETADRQDSVREESVKRGISICALAGRCVRVSGEKYWFVSYDGVDLCLERKIELFSASKKKTILGL